MSGVEREENIKTVQSMAYKNVSTSSPITYIPVVTAICKKIGKTLSLPMQLISKSGLTWNKLVVVLLACLGDGAK